MNQNTLPIRKAVAINDDRDKITDLFSLVARVRTQAKRLFRSSSFRILPTMTYDSHFHTYIFLVEFAGNHKVPSFEDTVTKLRSRV